MTFKEIEKEIMTLRAEVNGLKGSSRIEKIEGRGDIRSTLLDMGNGVLKIPTKQPNKPQEGYIYLNTSTNLVMCYTGGAWVRVTAN